MAGADTPKGDDDVRLVAAETKRPGRPRAVSGAVREDGTRAWSVRNARIDLSDLIDSSIATKRPMVIARDGTDVAAVVSIDAAHALLALQNCRDPIELQDILSRHPDLMRPGMMMRLRLGARAMVADVLGSTARALADMPTFDVTPWPDGSMGEVQFGDSQVSGSLTLTPPTADGSKKIFGECALQGSRAEQPATVTIITVMGETVLSFTPTGDGRYMLAPTKVPADFFLENAAIKIE